MVLSKIFTVSYMHEYVDRGEPISIIFEYHYLLIMNSLGWTSSGIP